MDADRGCVSADQSRGRMAAADGSWKSEKEERREDGEEPTSAPHFRNMEERITDMEVKEAVKKLTQQAVNPSSSSQKRTSTDDRSQSSAGHRFYNWNTTHFYPDVHKLDIGILFRHTDRFNRLDHHHHDRSASGGHDGGPGDVSSTSSSDDQEHGRKKKKKMLVTAPPKSHIDNVGATRNGLGVKIDIDLDSGSDSGDDGDKWHKSPVRLRRIRRQDGRPLSAEINYDAASKKLYIHTLSKKMDTSGKNDGRVSEPVAPRVGKISRRLSSPGTGASGPLRRLERKTEKGEKEVLRNRSAQSDSVGTSVGKTRDRRDFIKKLGKLQGLDFYDETRERARTGGRLGKRGDEVNGSSDLVSTDQLVSLCSGQLSRSQEDIRYIEPARTEWKVLGEVGDVQAKNVCAREKEAGRELRINAHSQPIANEKPMDRYDRRKNLEKTSLTKNDFGVSLSGKGFGWYPRTGSSFENIYDRVGSDGRRGTTAQEMELDKRKREKLEADRLVKDEATKVSSSQLKFPNIRPSSLYGETTGQKAKNVGKTKTDVDRQRVSPMAQLIPQPSSGCAGNATSDQDKPLKKSHIDAKTLMEEEKQKFEDYKMEYRRHWSGQESGGDEKEGVAKEGRSIEPPSIPPDDYVYILRKIHHTRQDALVHGQPQQTTASGLLLDLQHQTQSDGVPLSQSKPLHGSQARSSKNPMTPEEVNDWVAGQKTMQLPSEIYLDRYEYNRNMVMLRDGITSESKDDRRRDATEMDGMTSAFQRITRCGSNPHHHTDPVTSSSDGNPIHSRRPDLIPSPMAIATQLSYPTDTKQSKLREGPFREEPPLSGRTMESGLYPNSPDRVPRTQAGLLHKPPKPRKDEFSAGNVGPKQWLYNTTYEPSTPPALEPEDMDIFTSPVFNRDGQFPTEANLEVQELAPRDVCWLPPLPPPPPPPPSPPSNSMNVFRTLPEQYRLSIQEPSSAITDSLVTKNGILPLYHKDSNEGKVKIAQLPLNPTDRTRDRPYPPNHTHPMEPTINQPFDYKSGQRYDKATVFSITGFHKRTDDSDFMPLSVEPSDSFSRHPPPSESRDPDVNRDPLSSFLPYTSDSLRQTQWTNAEKRRPFVWNDRDKRRPIVDWPDLESLSTEQPEMQQTEVGRYQWPFEATFDPREEPPYERRNRLDLADRQRTHDVNNCSDGVDRQKIVPHESLGYYRRPTDSMVSPQARDSSSNQTDFSTPMNCQVRSSQVKGHMSEMSGSPQVFYAVQVPSGQANTAADDEGKSGVMEPLPYPPRPSSRVPQFNLNPNNQTSATHDIRDFGNQRDFDFGIEAQPGVIATSQPSNKQSVELGKRVWPLVTSEEGRKVKGVRSISQPDVWHPVSGSSGNVQLKTVLEKKLFHQKQLLSNEKTKDKTKDKTKEETKEETKDKTKEKTSAPQNQSKATAEYEKHINRSQESYKAKKMTTIDSELNEILPTTTTRSLILSAASSESPFKRCPSRDEAPSVVVHPKQKSALELHLSSSFVRPSASAGTTPSEDLQRSLMRGEQFNIEVDIQPPRTADSPQVFGMSVRLSASQEQLAQMGQGSGDVPEEEMPRISITAIKAKLFGENEDSTKRLITGRQLPIHVDPQQSKKQAALNKSLNGDEKDQMKLKTGSSGKSRNAAVEDERLYDYVSYKDGLKKKTSRIYDHLTDFERTYEGLNFDDDLDIDHRPPQNVSDGSTCRPDPPNVKRLSITNLKLLTESQERLLPKSSLDYTKEWIRTGKGPEFGLQSAEQRHRTTSENVDDLRTASTNSGIHSAENAECLGNFPRKVIDDMAYRKYGQSLMSAKSDPDLPFKAVPVGMSYPTVEPSRNYPSSDHCANQLIDSYRKTERQHKSLLTDVQPPKELKKVEMETQINSYKKTSPQHLNHPDSNPQSEETSNHRSTSRDGGSTRPVEPSRGTRVSLRQLNRSSSFESSTRREEKPETHPLPPSGVAKLVELFELSQSAPDLSEANLFGESYTETGNVKMVQKPRRQKTPKDVKLRSESRSRIRLLKVNADSGYVESESSDSSGPELQSPLTSHLTQKEGHVDNQQSNDDTQKQEQYLTPRLNFAGSVRTTGSCEEVSRKSETAEERMRRLQKLREDWFKKNPETEDATKPMISFDSRLTKRSTGESTQSQTMSTGADQMRSGFHSAVGSLPPANPPPTHRDSSLTKPGKSLDSLDSVVSSHESLGVQWQNVGKKCERKVKTSSTRTERTIGLDSVRGPEVQKTTINLSLSTPPAATTTKVEERAGDTSVLRNVSFPSNLVLKSKTTGPLHQLDSFDHSSDRHGAIEVSTGYQAKDVKVTEKQSTAGFSKERENQTFHQSSDRDRTITEMKMEKMRVEPWQFEASKRFERTVDRPTKKSFEYESQEFHHKEEVTADDDVKITKQQTQTRAERVFTMEKKPQPDGAVTRASASSSVGRKDLLFASALPPAFRLPSLIDRLDFSDGELTDATDVTLDAMVGFNQARPSSPETLDFSDVEIMSATAFPSSSRQAEGGRAGGGLHARTTQVVEKKRNSEGPSSQMVEAVTRNAGVSSKQEPQPTREQLLAKAQSEMKLYRKERGGERKTEEVDERRRSIKELVDSFEVMTMPFMRTRQRSSEIRTEDVEGAIEQKGNTRKD